MEPLSVPFAALFAVGAWADRSLRGAGARAAALFLGGAVFFAAPILLQRYAPLAERALPLAAFLATAAIAAAASARAPRLGVAAIAAVLVAFKIAAAPWSPISIAVPLGLSYYSLRAIAALVEIGRGAAGRPRPVEVAGFLGFSPVLSVGPIARLPAFLAARRADGAAALEGLRRIVEGLFKLVVVAPWLQKLSLPLAHAGPMAALWGHDADLLAVYAYALHLYADFSGASDLAIGAARFFGVRVAENFDHPYARTSLSDFWRSWHATLSIWLRDFLYFPIARRLPAAVSPIAAPILVMGVCGLWHGATLPFLAWGLAHGAGLATHQAWLRARRARPRLDALAAGAAGRAAGAALTFHFVAAAWILFAAPSLDAARARFPSIAARAAAAWPTALLACGAVGAYALLRDSDAVRRLAGRARPALDVALLAAVIVALWLARTAPERTFVYRAF